MRPQLLNHPQSLCLSEVPPEFALRQSRGAKARPSRHDTESLWFPMDEHCSQIGTSHFQFSSQSKSSLKIISEGSYKYMHNAIHVADSSNSSSSWNEIPSLEKPRYIQPAGAEWPWPPETQTSEMRCGLFGALFAAMCSFRRFETWVKLLANSPTPRNYSRTVLELLRINNFGTCLEPPSKQEPISWDPNASS